MPREFDGSGSGKISEYVYTFTYDDAGLPTKSVSTLDILVQFMNLLKQLILGNLFFNGTEKVASVKLDPKRFIAEIKSMDDAKVGSTERYTLTNYH